MASGIPARALIGWMDEASAGLALAGQWADDVQPSAEHRERHRLAKEAVAALAPLPQQRGVLAAPGPDLAEHFDRFAASPAFVAQADDRWSPAIADLTQIVAMQPVTPVVPLEGHPASRDDLAAIARLTLPLETPADPAATFDARHRWWVLSSESGNLRVRAEVADTDDEAGMTLGFRVGLQPSYVGVVVAEGRLVLRDGYRRALALLAAGITRAPVLVRTLGEGEPLGLRESLPAGALARPRPPLLPDMLDDSVSAAVLAPRTRSVIVVQALEVTEAVLDQ